MVPARLGRCLLAGLGVLASVFAAPLASGARQAAPAASPTAEATTAIVVTATHAPLRLPGSDGADHLEYDLLVTNVFAAPVTLTAVEVLTPDGGRLLRLDGTVLAQATQPLFGQEPTAAIPASGTVAVVMDVVVPRDEPVARLTHRLTYAIDQDAPGRSSIDSFAVDGPELDVDPRRAVVIAPPLRGDGWLAANGCCWPPSGHRSFRVAVAGDRIAKPETFAIDWIRLRDGKLFAGDGTRAEQWFGFGAEVLAVADGTVVSVHDGLPEEVPLQPAANVLHPADQGGNHVLLKIAPGVYAFYAHLQPGSITVAEGDRVTTGQVLGLLGNTGLSTAPHLHFDLIDAPDQLTGTSLPQVFARYTLVGAITREAFLAAATGSTEAGLIPEGSPQEQTATLPLDFTVVALP
jgi:hypothetical protein